MVEMIGRGAVMVLGQEGIAQDGIDAVGSVFERVADIARYVWSYELFTIDNATVEVNQLIIAVIVLLIGIKVAKIVSRKVGKSVLPRMRIDPGPASALESILYYFLMIVVVMLALQMASVPMTIFTIIGGALALGLGFGSQNIVSNFISGLILLIERPITVGQLVEVEGLQGVVRKVGPRSTHLEGYRGTEYIIPNSKLLETSVTNWNYRDTRVRSVVCVGVAYGSPTDRVKSLLLESCLRTDGVLSHPEPSILFSEFGDNALAFEVHFWSEPATTLARLDIESSLRFEIDRAFRESDIVIAFPQRDVHLDTARPLEVRVTQTA